MTTTNETMTLDGIERLTKSYAGEREELARLVRALNADIQQATLRCLAGIKRAVARAAEKELALRQGVEGAPELFDKPRTVIFHGIRVGFRKGSGAVTWDDDATLIARIEKQFTKPQAELLIKTTRKPIAKALADLDGAELKALGCRVENTGDEVVIKPVDGEVDKIVAALLKDATREDGDV